VVVEAMNEMKRVNPNSKRQKCFKLFDEGKTNKEVKEILGLSYELVKGYRYEWKDEKRVRQLRSVGGGGEIELREGDADRI
jgi:hypothetical protein